MTTATASTAGRVGRPRHIDITPPLSDMSPRDQILEAAARLFTSKGFAATSTREIAEAVGIRQASLYYHFAGKDEILSVLLRATVRPSRDQMAEIEALAPAEEDPALGLYLLALADIGTLVEAPHNTGLLFRLPEVVSAGDGEVHAGFARDRDDLVEAYTRLGSRLALRSGTRVSACGLGAQLIGQVETVIDLRAGAVEVDSGRAGEIAEGCLRLCGCGQAEVDGALSRADGLGSLSREGLMRVCEPMMGR